VNKDILSQITTNAASFFIHSLIIRFCVSMCHSLKDCKKRRGILPRQNFLISYIFLGKMLEINFMSTSIT